MRKMISRWICISAISLLIGGCSANHQSSNELTSIATMGIEPVIAASAAPEIEDPESGNVPNSSDPGKIKTFLSAQKIPNGDIYLQDNKVHINIVGLNSEVEQIFAQEFGEGSYELHDVKYTYQELLAAQELLHEQELYQKLNLYSSDVDTIGNKVKITMPDDYAEAAKLEIEKWINPGMLSYEISKLGQPHVVGEIVTIDTEKSKRILILETGNADPSYWFSIHSKSEMFDEAGQSLSFKDLKVGQQVKLWSTGAVDQSFPAHASVRRLELVEGSHN